MMPPVCECGLRMVETQNEVDRDIRSLMWECSACNADGSDYEFRFHFRRTPAPTAIWDAQESGGDFDVGRCYVAHGDIAVSLDIGWASALWELFDSLAQFVADCETRE